MKPTILVPSKKYENSEEVKAAFYRGEWFHEIRDGLSTGVMWQTVDSFNENDLVKIIYLRYIADKNFGDTYIIDREFSITFRVDKSLIERE
jgi:hypothetical protein